MIDPYRTVVINIISSLLLFGGVLIYRYIFPKKKINLFFLLILISILPIISIFRTGTYESGDFNIHIYRSMAFYDALRDGQFMPSWPKDLNATYGYPLFIFNYTLPYYLISLIHLVGFSFIYSQKIFLALSFILSGIFMYLFLKQIFKNNLAAFTSSVFYLFTPYHLISLHFKVTIGELLIFTLLPLAFLLVGKFITTKKLIYFFSGSILLALLILSHAVVGLFCSILIFLYMNIKRGFNLKILTYSLSLIIFSLILSLYNWAAPLIYKPYLFIQISPIKTVYFPKILELIYSPWRMGFLFQGPKGELSFLIGYTQLFILLAILYLLLIKKGNKKYLFDLKFWSVATLVLIFLITSYSKFLWENTYLIKGVGSHRLLILVGFSTSILAGYFALINKKNKIIYLIIAVAVLSTILNWGHRRVIPQIDDNVLRANLPLSTSQGEHHFYANSRWVNINRPWFSDVPKNKMEIINGDAKIINIKNSSTEHIYEITTEQGVALKENTLYFPGWEGYLNGRKIDIYPDNRGVINLKVLEGKYRLEIRYKDLSIYKISKYISLASFILFIIFIILNLFKKLKVIFPKEINI